MNAASFVARLRCLSSHRRDVLFGTSVPAATEAPLQQLTDVSVAVDMFCGNARPDLDDGKDGGSREGVVKLEKLRHTHAGRMFSLPGAADAHAILAPKLPSLGCWGR